MDYRVTLSSFPTTYDEMIALPEVFLKNRKLSWHLLLLHF